MTFYKHGQLASASEAKDFPNVAKYQKAKYGVVGWYDWACKNWGTKWEACFPEIDGDTVAFMTAWALPEPFFQYLAEHYDISIDDGTFDEECQNFYGTFTIKDGKFNVEYLTYEDETEEEETE